MTDKFLAHVQVLRGVSILVVLLFHLGLPWAGSGYFGVDIFFVISGFLMAHLYGDLSDRSAAMQFYARRLWRILPAYLVVLVITLALMAAFFSLPSELVSTSEDALWSAALMPNVGFWMDDAYFDDELFRPFLHFWSLGVELQFYLVFPLIIWLGRGRAWLLVLIGLGSFAAYGVVHAISAKTAFFLMPFRVWEFLVGFAAAGLISRLSGKWTAFGLAAFIGLIGWMFVFPNTWREPVIHALAIVGFSTAVIACGLPDWLNTSWPGRAIQKLGTYSYSIYLTHFPVIIFWSYAPFEGNAVRLDTPVDYLGVLALSIGLGIVLHHLVETRFRHPRSARAGLAGVAVAVAAVIGTGYVFGAVKAATMPANEYRVAAAMLDRDDYRCGKVIRLLDPSARSCALNDVSEDGEHVLLVGNSHADVIKRVFADTAERHGATVWFMVKNVSVGGGISPEAVLEEATHRRVTRIVLHSRRTEVRPNAIEALAALTAGRGIDIDILDPVPDPGSHVPKALFQDLRTTGEADRTRGTLASYAQANADILPRLSATTASHAHVRRFPIADVFCTPDCAVMDKSGTPLYFDDNHLTRTGVRLLVPVFETMFGRPSSRDDNQSLR